MSSEPLKSSKELRAKRVKMLRGIAGLTLRAFEDKYSIPTSNFQNWEGPRYGGLTENGAKKILLVCEAEGIDTTLEWLMHGVEPGPRLNEKYLYKHDPQRVSEVQNILQMNSELGLIADELSLFKRNYQQQTLDMMVVDDGMEPFYSIGDYVAGKYFSGSDLAKAVGCDCIVRLEDGSLLFRHLKIGTNDKSFTLTCTNNQANVDQRVISDIIIHNAAPVIWHRRKVKGSI